MKVYKFGGASVSTADGVRNLRAIVKDERELFVIVSAMGKTTNALERVFEGVQTGDRPLSMEHITALRSYHRQMIEELMRTTDRLDSVDALFAELEQIATSAQISSDDSEMWYDRIVSYGELLSTTIIAEYLNASGVPCRWIDMRRCFITNERHKDASIDLEASTAPLTEAVSGEGAKLFIGQGFIGSTPSGKTSTLGREGSDYSAAGVANILDAESMSVWKDVDGVLNADPRIFPDARHIEEMSYLNAIELSYSGASIIHPKTVKPLQNKNIPLYVRPFGDRRKPGTVIRRTTRRIDVPILIVKHNQVLVTVRARDLSFIIEERFADIFGLLDRHRIRTNLIHNSAVNLSLCIDRSWRLDEAVAELRAEGYDVMCIEDMELLTIRGYEEDMLARFVEQPNVYISQRTQTTLRVVRKK
ncbi:MAG: aspartate kinase [Rikenellaceae bacterium]|nr:aspartate kinase [Rikenellaceae bacterium]